MYERWRGVAVVIGREWDAEKATSAYWVSHGGELLLVNTMHLRHATAEERFADEWLVKQMQKAIAPGIVHTPMHGRPLEETEARHAGRIPLGRIGQPTDIVGAAVFLASKSANYITGQVLHVNGGMVMND